MIKILIQYCYQSCKKGCSTVALLPEENGQKHLCQKDFCWVYHIFWVFKNKLFINLNSTEVSQKNKCFCSKYIRNSQLIFFFKANDITIINPSAGRMISGVCKIIKSSCFPPNISNVCFKIFLLKNKSSCYYQENLEKICLKKIYQITKS